MTVGFGRIIRRAALGEAPERVQSLGEAQNSVTGRLLRRSEAEALDRAGQIIAAAERRAISMVEQAERVSSERRLLLESQARATALADFAALAVKHARREELIDREQMDRSIAIATLLAERILGEVLSLDPSRIGALAREVLREVHGARRVVIATHPQDADRLRTFFGDFDAKEEVCRVVADTSLARGDLRVQTDLGVICAELGDRLEQLADRLREELKP